MSRECGHAAVSLTAVQSLAETKREIVTFRNRYDKKEWDEIDNIAPQN
jgi:hypothetical protein